jgi:hypothetical protein
MSLATSQGEQSSGEAAVDQSEFCCHSAEWLTADYADITDIQRGNVLDMPPTFSA